MNENCEGCASLSQINPNNNSKCCGQITFGMESIPNCPCYDCLIKPVCRTSCDKFKQNIRGRQGMGYFRIYEQKSSFL
jgi:hypothetical protein